MLTLGGFLESFGMLSKGFGKKPCQETADLFYHLCRKKLPEMDDVSFREVVEEILSNEKYFPTFSKIVEYYNLLAKRKSTPIRTNNPCEYCKGKGRVSVEVFEPYYQDYAVVNVRCACVPEIEGIASLNEKLKRKIDNGEFFLDRDMVYRKPERARFDVGGNIRKKHPMGSI